MRFFEFLGRFFYTRKCPSCGELLDFDVMDEAFCSECRDKWEIEKAAGCVICSRSVCECECMTKTLSSSGALTHRKIVKYSLKAPVVHNTLIFIKQNNNPRVSGFLASELSAVVLSDSNLKELCGDDAVVSFVPRSRSAIVKYGHDQSAIIAELLADKLGISFSPLLKRKLRKGVAQKRLNAKKRAKNVKNMFCVIKKSRESLVGKTVFLFDDIVTTGSSIGACTSCLIKAGASNVICLSVATTENTKTK